MERVCTLRRDRAIGRPLAWFRGRLGTGISGSEVPLGNVGGHISLCLQIGRQNELCIQTLPESSTILLAVGTQSSREFRRVARA